MTGICLTVETLLWYNHHSTCKFRPKLTVRLLIRRVIGYSSLTGERHGMTNLMSSHIVKYYRSDSMNDTDCQPLGEGPAATRIQGVANNRLGAVYLALYNFWSARHAAAAAGKQALGAQRRSDTVYFTPYNQYLRSGRSAGSIRDKEPVFTRRDSYSVILFDHYVKNILVNDVTSSPDQLLEIVLRHRADGGTNFTNALLRAQNVMVKNWSEERFVA